ncbi:hypothetical protein [Gemmata massiliana]|uniref:hypothetical protein n=1 Tax=Gemmata massiliana TaxID=1210884 RepID=UPI0013A6F3A8|nr:hypothetical protein [Gemmata massiliana]
MGRLVSALGEVRATGVRRAPGAVAFKGGPFRWVSSRNVLIPISRGRVEIVRGSHGLEAYYQLSFVGIVAPILVGLGFMIGFTIVEILLDDEIEFRPEVSVALMVGIVLIMAFRLRIAIDQFSTFVKRVAFAELPK